MIYFPQLSSGSVSQYPLTRSFAFRTVVNRTLGGARTTFSDRQAVTIRWDLKYEGLTKNEADALSMFFEETCGRLKPFVFLDPASNLLLWSEQLSRPAWNRDSLLILTTDRPDPLGTQRASRFVNGAQSDQSLRQEIAAPGGFTYCLALTARAEAPTDITVKLESAGETISHRVRVAERWSEALVSGVTTGNQETIRAVITLEAGASVDLFGIHLQAQAGSDGYRPTTDISGIHAETYFDTDEMDIQADRNDEFSCRVWLVSRIGSNQ